MALSKIENSHHKAQKRLIEMFLEFNGKETPLADIRRYLELMQTHIKSKEISKGSKYANYIGKIQKQCVKIINYAGKQKFTHIKIDINKKDAELYKSALKDQEDKGRTFNREMAKKAASGKTLSGSVKKGTNKWKTEFAVQGNYGSRWEDVTTEETRKEANVRLREYRENESKYPHRVISRKVLNKDKKDLGCPGKKKCGCEMGETEEFTTPVISLTKAIKIAKFHSTKKTAIGQFANNGNYIDDNLSEYLEELEGKIKYRNEGVYDRMSLLSLAAKKISSQETKNLISLRNFFIYKHHERNDLKGLNGLGSPKEPSCLEPNPKKVTRLSGNDMKGLGFTTADNRSSIQQANTLRLKGEFGKLLQKIEPYRYAIVMTGDPEAGKTEALTQLADEFIDTGLDVAMFSLEQGGMESKLTQGAVDRNVKKSNQKKLYVTGEGNIDSIKKATKHFKVIMVDSFGKLGVNPQKQFDLMRTEYPDTIWVFIFQQTTEGTVRGGSAVEFDSPVVIRVHKPDHTFVNNWIEVIKNRGNDKDVHYKMGERKTHKGHKPEIV